MHKQDLINICLPNISTAYSNYPVEEWLDNPGCPNCVKLQSIRNNPKNILKIKNLTEPFLCKLADVNSIKNPTTDMKQLAISLNPDVIRYMKRPTEKLQLLAIKQNPNLINYIKKPTEKIILLALQKLNYPADLIMKYIFSGQLSEKSINLLYNEIIARDIIK